MKLQERKEAIKLREEGCSLKEICKILNVAKSSVSTWVRNVQLTQDQIKHLKEKGFYKEIIEKRRFTRLLNEQSKRQKIIDFAKNEIKSLSTRELWLIGTILYWAEGGKTNRSLVRFSNSDTETIKFMMVFFRKVCKVPEKSFRGYLHIHPHLDHIEAEKYWSSVTQIPLNQFYKTNRKLSIASQQKKDSIPLGTFDIYICDTQLFLKIFGWMQGVYTSSNDI